MPPRFSIAALMALVVVVALELAAARAAWDANPGLLLGIVPTAVVVNFATWWAIRRGGRRRAFAIGFVAGALPVMASYIWAMLTAASIGINPADGTLHRTGGSLAYDIWMGYARAAFRPIEPYVANLIATGLAMDAIRACLWTVPQLTIGLATGLLAVSLWGRKDCPAEARESG